MGVATEFAIARRLIADADQMTQEQPEIEAASVDQQSLADVGAISIHRLACCGILLPLPSPAIRVRDVAADAHGFEIDERLVAVIALVADEFFDDLPVGPHCFDLLGRLDQCLAAGATV